MNWCILKRSLKLAVCYPANSIMDLIWFGAEILWLLVNDDRQTCARFLKLQRSPRTLQLLINLQVICCKACVCTRKYIGVAATDLNTDL